MRAHDWTKVYDGAWHDFYLSWIGELRKALNMGILPKPYYALAEQKASIYKPDILTLQQCDDLTPQDDSGGGTATLASPAQLKIMNPPKTRQMLEGEESFYLRKQRQISIRICRFTYKKIFTYILH